jgi:hypothetical protein
MNQKNRQISAKPLGSTQEKFVEEMSDFGLKYLRKTLIHALGNLSM